MAEIQYQLIRSSRKTLALQIRNGSLIVRAPYFTTQSEIEKMIREKRQWIESHLEKSCERVKKAENIQKLSREELEDLAKRALEYIPRRAAYYAKQMGVRYGRITIRNQKTRWGSCSGKGNLNFNCILMLTPPEVIDSVVVHELSHLKEMNHSDKFYREVYRVYPEYDRWHSWLKEHGDELLARLE